MNKTEMKVSKTEQSTSKQVGLQRPAKSSNKLELLVSELAK